jgi:hypothetical protein
VELYLHISIPHGVVLKGLTSALEGGKSSDSRPGCFISRECGPLYLKDRMMGGPQCRPVAVETKQHGIEGWSFGRQAHSPTLCPLSYLGSWPYQPPTDIRHLICCASRLVSSRLVSSRPYVSDSAFYIRRARQVSLRALEWIQASFLSQLLYSFWQWI